MSAAVKAPPTPWWERHPEWTATAAMAVLYLLTASWRIGTWDSPERALAAVHVGFSHPPGSPMHALIGAVWTRVLGVFEPAIAMNLLSAVAGALGAGLIVALGRVWGLERRDALLVALSVACSAMVWSECLYSEAYGVHWALWAGFLLTFSTWWHTPHEPRWLVAAAYLFTMAFCVQSGGSVMAPAIVLLVVVRRPRILREPPTLLAVTGAVVVALTPLLIIFLRSETYGYMGSEDLPTTWEGFRRYISAAQFQRYSLVEHVWPDLLRERLAQFVVFVVYSFVGIGLIPMAWAAWRLIRIPLGFGALIGVAILSACLWYMNHLVWAAFLAMLAPAAMAFVAARNHRLWLGSLLATSALLVFTLGVNVTTEFRCLIMPLWAFIPIVIAMASSPDAGPVELPRWVTRTLIATVAAQLIVFPLLSVWGPARRPYHHPDRQIATLDRVLDNLAKLAIRKRVLWFPQDEQERDLQRLERDLRLKHNGPIVLLVRWEIQTSIEYCKRIRGWFQGVWVVEHIDQLRYYKTEREGSPLFKAPDADELAINAWPDHGVFYLIATNETFPTLPFDVIKMDTYHFDDRDYRLYYVKGHKMP